MIRSEIGEILESKMLGTGKKEGKYRWKEDATIEEIEVGVKKSGEWDARSEEREVAFEEGIDLKAKIRIDDEGWVAWIGEVGVLMDWTEIRCEKWSNGPWRWSLSCSKRRVGGMCDRIDLAEEKARIDYSVVVVACDALLS
ncbi:hypothetical protein Tco_0233058 [Tanacetum coccineum]